MAHTYEELHALNVTELRKIAEGIDHEAVHGFRTMHKDKLLPAICKALGIEAHIHHHVVGINKVEIKSKIKQLKGARAAAIEQKDYSKLKSVRQQIHDLKGKLRRSIVS